MHTRAYQHVIRACLLLLLLGASRLAAQDVLAPIIIVSATTPNSFGATAVSIAYCDPVSDDGTRQSGMSMGSRQVLWNGADSTGVFSSYVQTNDPACWNSFATTKSIVVPVGTTTLVVSASDLRANSTTESIIITRAGAPPVQQRVAPSVTLANMPGDFQDPGLCVADCFEKTFSFSTPAYKSLEQSRSYSLLYRSRRATPRAMIALNVADASPTRAQSVSLRIRRPNGTDVTFPNGGQELYYTNGSSGIHMAADFDPGLPTGRYVFSAIVTSRWSDTSTVTSAPVPVIIVNDVNSPYGAGVEIAGIQRVFPQSDGVLVTDGSGAASFFAGCNTCALTSPAGDFSTVVQYFDGYRRNYADGTSLLFNSSGEEQQAIGRFGDTTRFTFMTTANNTRGVQNIVDPAGVSTTIEYRPSGDATFKAGGITKIVQHLPSERFATFTVDANNDLVQWSDYEPIATYSYLNHLPISFTGRDGLVWNFVISAGGMLSEVKTPDINLGGGIHQRIVTRLVGPYASALAQVASGGGTPTSYLSATTDLRTSIAGARNDTTYFVLNRFGQATNVTTPDGRGTAIGYTNAGQVESVAPPSPATFTYNTWIGAYMTTSNTGGSLVQYEYTPRGDLKHVYGAVPEQFLTYDETKLGAPLTTVESGAQVTTYLFTPDGRISSVTDPEGHTSTWTYEAAGLKNLIEAKSVTASGSRLTALTNDAWGRTTAVTDPLGNVTRSSYDVLNRVYQTIGARSDTTWIEYDKLGNTTKVTDTRHQVYQYGPNQLGWMEWEQDPIGNRKWFRFDVAGNVTAATNRRNQVVNFTYDVLGRVTTRYQQYEGQTTTYGYDPNGLWTSASNGASTDTLRIDYNGRLVAQSATRLPNNYTRLIRQTNEAATGRRTGINVLLNGASGDSVVFGYNALGQLATVRDPLANMTSIGYNDDGLPQTLTYPSGMVRTDTYSSAHALSGSTYNVTAVNQAFSRFYGQDLLGRTIGRENSSRLTRNFAYDSSGGLISDHDYQQSQAASCHTDPDLGRVCDPIPPTDLGGRTYAYDKVGNPLAPSITIGTQNQIGVFAGDSLIYDAEGNLTRRYRVGSTWTLDQWYGWNSLGQLVQVNTTRNGVTQNVYFSYDGFGRRVRKYNTTTAAVTDYVWDGDQLVEEVDVNGNTQRLYTYLPGSDNLHSVVTGGQTYYAATDAQGNVIGMVRRGDNAVMSQYAYQPFGTLELDDQNVPNALRWKGLQYDAETGLYFMRARYYAPDLGRFISQDPIGLEGGINQYAFAGNDPVNGSDPSGLCTIFHGWTYLANDPGNTWDHNWSIDTDGCFGSNTGPGFLESTPGGVLGRFSEQRTIGPAGPRLADDTKTRILNRGPACTAAAIDAAAATAGDLISLTGFGMVATRGTRGARLGLKLLRASQWLVRDRVIGALSPTNSGSLRSIATWQANALVGASWQLASNSLQGEDFDIGEELLGLIPGINMGMKIAKAVQKCF